MVAKNVTPRTATKNIRFPHLLIAEIQIALQQEGESNFSAWVIEACSRRIKDEQHKASDS
ncbi:YlcI/YnfO family protein [Rouxiella sp. Mn2063]|uniref:YlcI/YnfO family protein n=1 Tax=Rouxiella sp. Mn2063 TaxID=3395262 RepID=UPI003BEB2399